MFCVIRYFDEFATTPMFFFFRNVPLSFLLLFVTVVVLGSVSRGRCSLSTVLDDPTPLPSFFFCFRIVLNPNVNDEVDAASGPPLLV